MHVLTALLAALPADVGQPTPVQPPGTQDLNTLLNWMLWGVNFALILGVLVVAAMMAIAWKRGESGEHVSRLGWILGAGVLATGASTIINTLV